MFPQEYYKADD